MLVVMSFPKQIILALCCVSAAGAYPVLKLGSIGTVRAAACGAFLMTANVLAGYAAVNYSIGKSTTTFMKYVLGGMGIRMLVLVVIMLILIERFEVDAGALVASMGIFYVVYVTLEIIFIQQKVNAKQQN